MANQRALVGNAGDEKQVRKATSAERRRLDQERQDLEAVLALPAGQRFVWGLLTQCNLYRSTFRGEATHDAAFQEGRRDVGLYLMARIEAVRPSLFLEMMRARAQQRADEETEASSPPTDSTEDQSDA